jgi:cytochrome c-type biogenesis protein CcmH/NrfG
MQTVAKSNVDGVRIALAVALLAACAVNLLLLCAWL